jgi:hypothetical protein
LHYPWNCPSCFFCFSVPHFHHKKGAQNYYVLLKIGGLLKPVAKDFYFQSVYIAAGVVWKSILKMAIGVAGKFIMF